VVRARSLNFVLTVVCWVLCGAPANAELDQEPATPGELEALMNQFASSGGVRAHFREIKHLALLSAPIESEGTLYFAPPSRLARYTSRPGKARVVINGERAAFHDPTGHQEVDLESSEVASHLVGNLVVLLRGDLPGLLTRHHVTLHGDSQGWVLELEPRSRVVRSMIESIRIKGNGVGLLEMETRESSGDKTIMRFSQVETGVDFAAAELERIFSLEAPDDTL
jgi:outer membrane lipoprotein-sorting protein